MLTTVALTNTPGSAITQRCGAVVDLVAESEVGGVACRSYQHTLALLVALECHLIGAGTESYRRVRRGRSRQRPPACSTPRPDWRPQVSELY